MKKKIIGLFVCALVLSGQGMNCGNSRGNGTGNGPANSARNCVGNTSGNSAHRKFIKGVCAAWAVSACNVYAVSLNSQTGNAMQSITAEPGSIIQEITAHPSMWLPAIVSPVPQSSVPRSPITTPPVTTTASPSDSPTASPTGRSVTFKQDLEYIGVPYKGALSGAEVKWFKSVFGNDFDPTQCRADNSGFCLFESRCWASVVTAVQQAGSQQFNQNPLYTPSQGIAQLPQNNGMAQVLYFPECTQVKHACTTKECKQLACKDSLIGDLARLPKGASALVVTSFVDQMSVLTYNKTLSVSMCIDFMKSGAAVGSMNIALIACALSAVMLNLFA